MAGKIHERIRVNGRYIEAFSIPLQTRNLIILKGRGGYVMCGYLNMNAANKFKDAAVKITGAGTIREALAAKVVSCSAAARKMGVVKNQPVRRVLEIIA